MDPDAEESIVQVVDEHVGDDTLVYLPPGRYVVDETVELTEFEDDSYGVVWNCRFDVTRRPIVTQYGSTVSVTNSVPAELNGESSGSN